MPGFVKSKINTQIKSSIFTSILNKLDESLDKLHQFFLSNDTNCNNHEDTITTILYEKFLRIKIDNFIVQIQARENPINYKYIGIADLKFINISNQDKYFIVECKRLDGGKILNKEYIEQGIYRFIPNPIIKYKSPYNKNFMIGYVIKNIDIEDNIINNINVSLSPLKLINNNEYSKDKINTIRISNHQIDNGELMLIHIFAYMYK